VLEGIGAAMVLPAMVALIAGSYEGKERALDTHRQPRRPDPGVSALRQRYLFNQAVL